MPSFRQFSGVFRATRALGRPLTIDGDSPYLVYTGFDIGPDDPNDPITPLVTVRVSEYPTVASEPGTAALLGLGLVAGMAVRRARA